MATLTYTYTLHKHTILEYLDYIQKACDNERECLMILENILKRAYTDYDVNRKVRRLIGLCREGVL